MNQTTNLPARKDWKVTLSDQMPTIAMALPAHVTPEKFERIVANAIGSTPLLAKCLQDAPKTVWSSVMACAKDGLIPDGREAAFVPFKSNGKFQCQYIPMIGGILKMMRQSGEVLSLTVEVVYANDNFDYELGDDARISHKPRLDGPRGAPIAAYAILKTKDGGIYREVMSKEDIMKVKAISKAKNGPWSGPFETEMWKKTVLRRLAKRSPLSTDVIDLIQRDDGMYELPGKTIPEERSTLNMLTGEVSEPDVEDEIDEAPEEDDSSDDVTDAEYHEVEEEPEAVAETVPEERPSPPPRMLKASASKADAEAWAVQYRTWWLSLTKAERDEQGDAYDKGGDMASKISDEAQETITDALNSPAADDGV
jgi:recombination protein RecT